ncbi:hypothetical protein SK128_000137, partial [Halocaridina rubra]
GNDDDYDIDQVAIEGKEEYVMLIKLLKGDDDNDQVAIEGKEEVMLIISVVTLLSCDQK